MAKKAYKEVREDKKECDWFEWDKISDMKACLLRDDCLECGAYGR